MAWDEIEAKDIGGTTLWTMQSLNLWGSSGLPRFLSPPTSKMSAIAPCAAAYADQAFSGMSEREALVCGSRSTRSTRLP